MKRHILQELQNGCPIHSTNPSRQSEILTEFGHYLKDYTPEEIEWYGHTFDNALNKLEKELRDKAKAEAIPQKVILRQRLIEQLRENQELKKAEVESGTENVEE